MNRCPYRDLNNNHCCHKARPINSKRKIRLCGFQSPNHCEFYNEWLELKKMQQRASMDFIDLSEFQSGIPINEALKDEE